jgi:putative nucleotidyltransferase with HDIG domain
MDEQASSGLVRYLPQVCLGTALVGLCPVVAGWALTGAGVIRSTLISVLVVVALSLAASYVGGAFWRSRPGSGDLLFSELMLWGWLRRWWNERRLGNALLLLSGLDEAEPVDRLHRQQQLTELVTALEARDPYTHRHSRRVARHSAMVAKRMGLSAGEVAKVRTAAALHDVGKVNTPRAVLNKSGLLTNEEFEVIKRHPVDGAEMVAALEDPELTAMVRHHHERLDGHGYPDGLRAELIPLGARIIAVADTFDAITSARPYRPARSHKRAMAILQSEAGEQLDPEAVQAFQSYYAGRRPLVLWLALTNLPTRALSWVGGSGNVAAASVGRVMTTTAVTGAVAAAAVVPHIHAFRHLGSPGAGSSRAVRVASEGGEGSATSASAASSRSRGEASSRIKLAAKPAHRSAQHAGSVPSRRGGGKLSVKSGGAFVQDAARPRSGKAGGSTQTASGAPASGQRTGGGAPPRSAAPSKSAPTPAGGGPGHGSGRPAGGQGHPHGGGGHPRAGGRLVPRSGPPSGPRGGPGADHPHGADQLHGADHPHGADGSHGGHGPRGRGRPTGRGGRRGGR